MTSTLRAPTYPSYDGRTIDKTEEGTLTFTNNADYPLIFGLNFTDLDSGSPTSGTLLSEATRGATISANVAGFLTAGHDYACTLTVYGRDPSAAEGSTSPGKYDVLLGTGKLQDDSDVTSTVYLNKGITCIKSPSRSGDTLQGGCAVKISNDTYLITAYNATTGAATISAEPINGSTATLRTTAAGETYSLISNYVVGQPFTFKVRSEPSCTLSYSVTNSGRIRVTGAYSQAQNVPLQSYKMTAVYRFDSGLTATIEHEKTYSTTISEDFPISPETTGYMCEISCEVTTADDCTKTFTLNVPALATADDIGIAPSVGTSFDITGRPAGAFVHVWREERDKIEESTISQYDRVKYLGKISAAHYDDHIAGHQRTYRYHVAVVETSGTVHYSPYTSQINVYDRSCTIWQMTRLGVHEYQLMTNSYCTFRCDVDSGTVETVTGNAVYKSSAAKPKYIRGSDAYDTGTLTAILGTVVTPEAGPADIRKFVEMMTSEGIFLLKTDYGDVKIVAIVDNPARTYGASIEELGITKVSFSWAEIDDIDTAVIVYGQLL